MSTFNIRKTFIYDRLTYRSEKGIFGKLLTFKVRSQAQLRQCVLHSMAEWHNRNVDIPDRLSKLFQIAIKLKVDNIIILIITIIIIIIDK